jgi:uroporphyrinogen decarboxylase
MIEGGGSRNYLFTKKMMYSAPAAWNELMKKLVAVTAEYSTEQVRAGADTIQIFDSWVGCLSVEDYRRYVLPHVTDLVKRLQQDRRACHLLRYRQLDASPLDAESGAEVRWPGLAHSARHRLAEPRLEGCSAGQSGSGALFADWKELKKRAEDILRQAAGRPGHIFNLGHGILPETPVENVKALCDFIREHSADFKTAVKSKH